MILEGQIFNIQLEVDNKVFTFGILTSTIPFERMNFLRVKAPSNEELRELLDLKDGDEITFEGRFVE